MFEDTLSSNVFLWINKKNQTTYPQKKKKNANPKMQTPYFPIEISDSLWLPLLRCNSIDTQISIPCSRPTSTRKGSEKIELCSSSATVKAEELCSSLQQAAIQNIIQKAGILIPIFWFSTELPFLGFWKLL